MNPFVKQPQPMRAPVRGAGAIDVPLIANLVNSEDYDMVRRMAFALLLVVVFLRFGYLHETLYLSFGIPYLMLVSQPLAMLTAFMCGALGRTLQSQVGKMFFMYGIWMIPCTVFSTWIGGSVEQTKTYWLYFLPFVALIGGVIASLKELRAFMYTGAFAAVAVMAARKLAGSSEENGRMVHQGSIGNSNDYAAVLVFLVPFLGFAAINKKTPTVIRLASVGLITYGVFLILSTGSRAGLIALAAMIAFVFFFASNLQKMLVVVLAPVLIVGLLTLLPPVTFARITSIFNKEAANIDPESVKEAEASSAARRYLFMRGVELTVTHPLFGVGPGQFAVVEGKTGNSRGNRGNYQETHNTPVQFSSETGIVGAGLIVIGIISGIGAMRRVYKQASRIPGQEEMARIALMLLLSTFGLLVMSMFLSLANLFYYPSIAGMAIMLERIWSRQLGSMQLAQGVATVIPAEAKFTKAPAMVSTPRIRLTR